MDHLFLVLEASIFLYYKLYIAFADHPTIVNGLIPRFSGNLNAASQVLYFSDLTTQFHIASLVSSKFQYDSRYATY